MQFDFDFRFNFKDLNDKELRQLYWIAEETRRSDWLRAIHAEWSRRVKEA